MLSVMTEKQQFLATFDVIMSEIVKDLDQYRLPANGKEWIKKMLYDTVPGGRMS